jgi:hypothetical protein
MTKWYPSRFPVARAVSEVGKTGLRFGLEGVDVTTKTC